MNRTVKLILDVMMGMLIPILILNNLNEQFGTETTYITAALVPVAWVFIDLFFITKRFNFITSYVGVFAIMRGLLAFWLVDKIQFAFKDSVGFIFTTVVFGGSILIRKPIMYYFVVQSLNPSSPRQERALKALLQESGVYRSLIKGTRIVLMIALLTGIANFFLNLQIVVADFGTATFNQQVARVNAITQVALTIPEFIGFWIAALSVRQAMFYYLPKERGKEQHESDFWDLLRLRESQQDLINPQSSDNLKGLMSPER
ncbi:MAG: VC0807 family protein [Cyanobacteria bacterium J06635_15]